MDRDPAQLKSRKLMMRIWDYLVSLVHTITLFLITAIAVIVYTLLQPYGTAVQIAALAIIAPIATGWIKSINNVNKDMKRDVMTGCRFISQPSKTLADAYDQVDEQITAHCKTLKDEDSVVFISSLTYYPTQTKRRHVVAASVVFTLQR